ncbi:MAG: tetratricopeptide repeat protein [Pyrinomonadaceae bacterium]
MNLTDSCFKELENPALTQNERILLRCRLASDSVEIGQYELAREALGELWPGVGRRPIVEQLKPLSAAEVLLQCGVLTGWLGSIQDISGSQEKAKDLLFESLRIFQTQRQDASVAEAQYEMSRCYFRLGAYDDARLLLDKALSILGAKRTDLRARIFIRQSIIEIWTGRYHDAWAILEKAREFFEASNNTLKGKWHGQRGLVLQRLALTERRTDYADRSIVEFTAAIYHYEVARHERYCGNNLNNLAMLLFQLGRYSEAHENLDRAQTIFERHGDSGDLTHVNETRARVLVAEGHYEEANSLITAVIQMFERGNEYGRLADALTIQGVVWARLGLHERSLHILRHAMSVAQNSGAYSNAGLAALTLIEEHGNERLSASEFFSVYRRADELLKDTQDTEEIARLRACARIMSRKLLGVRLSDKTFILPKAVHDYEAQFIREALEAEQGVVSRAAKRLGVGHQLLVNALKTRHKELLSLRTPARPRRKTIMGKH